MAKINFITKAGVEMQLEAASGSVMELAVNNSVPGIDGDCGGVCSCATCHVHVAPEDWAQTGAPGDMEKDMLEFDDNASEFSRLSCQMSISDELDGITLKVAN
ncbi:2Fe-2S iron-sulfur cluster binding domain-containing protein [Neolewinella aurantiaca]|uniref:2Fe-2S iron-sulfur cluster binding domain-containing protein n=1 Tax=Neolewinella aurantiaca TaxID=2602767 RepID=A0A5C7FAS2_9BACT|nr:2Fe-2S iron-sulfur cluster-binding protein [Neolewinella aurantiaca]TXF87917.1 2Fe-2S iron-sulfur cluster binding domain-containing protein [Neolewinella aurantiaca]